MRIMNSVQELACGAVDRFAKPHGESKIQVQLWREHGIYHVRAHNFDSHRRLVWRSFSRVTEARREFKKQVSQVRTGMLY